MRFSERELCDDVVYALYEIKPTLTLIWWRYDIVSAPKATEFGEIMQQLGLLRCSRSFNVIEFGTNRKPIWDFLLVINSNLPPILHRFRDTASKRYKIDTFF